MGRGLGVGEEGDVSGLREGAGAAKSATRKTSGARPGTAPHPNQNHKNSTLNLSILLGITAKAM